jgi:hypothetical protein
MHILVSLKLVSLVTKICNIQTEILGQWMHVGYPYFMISWVLSHQCIGGYLNLPRPDDPSPVDKSEALFSMYLEKADEDDKKITERWRAESDAILIFVSHSYQACARVPLFNTEGSRLVFSQPLSPFSFRFLYKTFGRIHRTTQRSISQTSTMCSPILLPPSPSSFPHQPTRLHFLHRHTRSWLTHFGS